MERFDWKAGFRRASVFILLYAVILYAMSVFFPETFGIREGQLQAIVLQGVFFFLILGVFFSFTEKRRKERIAEMRARKQGKQPKPEDEGGEPSAFKGRPNPNTSRKKPAAGDNSRVDIHRILEPPVETAEVLEAVPELALAQGLGQGPYHHLDVFEHTMEVMRSVERELREDLLGARVSPERVRGLRLVGLLHDVAKPVTRGEYDGKVLFVAHDTLGARLAHRICRRLEISAEDTDLVATLTALHLKIGFMGNERSDYPPPRLARAAGPFGEELAVLSWADRVAAQGPRLKQEHLDRHYDLCAEFLGVSREHGPYSPDYENLVDGSASSAGADAGYAASHVRLAGSRGLGKGGVPEQAPRDRGSTHSS